MTQFTNYSISQEKEIIHSIHFEHKFKGKTSNGSIKELNILPKLVAKFNDKETAMHLYYETLTDEENGLLFDLLNLIGNYGSLTFWQLNEFAHENSPFYVRQRSVSQALNELVKMNLVEKIQFTITTDNAEINGKKYKSQEKLIDAFVVTKWAIEVLEHNERELTTKFPINRDSKKFKYLNCIKCWQAYDFESILKQQEYFVNGYVESNENNEIVYHCWLNTDFESKIIYELVICFPLQSKLLEKKNDKYEYNITNLKNLGKNFNPKFLGVKALPKSYNKYHLKKIGVIRVTKKPTVNDFINITTTYQKQGKGKLALLMGNGYDDGVRFDKKFGGTISDCFYYLMQNDKGENKVFKLKFGKEKKNNE